MSNEVCESCKIILDDVFDCRAKADDPSLLENPDIKAIADTCSGTAKENWKQNKQSF